MNLRREAKEGQHWGQFQMEGERDWGGRDRKKDREGVNRGVKGFKKNHNRGDWKKKARND